MADHITTNRKLWNRTSDEYQELHSPQLDQLELAWGVWGLPEAELGILGDVRGQRILEYGCGAAQWSLFLEQAGALPVGLDLSERQLAHAHERATRAGARVPLVHANAERAPFADASFDIVFCDHGAMTFADPLLTVPEVARLVRPGGLFAFNISSPLWDLFHDHASDKQTDRVNRNYFEMRAIASAEAVCFQLPYGRWLRLFRENGFEVEDLIELRPPPGSTSTYSGFDSLERARTWPIENIWKLRRR